MTLRTDFRKDALREGRKSLTKMKQVDVDPVSTCRLRLSSVEACGARTATAA